jgi:ferredoxin
MIQFTIEDAQGNRQLLEAPDDMNLNLMEIMKANEYPVLATCGGMALCATCHVEVVEGLDRLGESSDAELDMIDTLPNASDCSRLACQLRINEALQGAVIRFMGEEV